MYNASSNSNECNSFEPPFSRKFIKKDKKWPKEAKTVLLASNELQFATVRLPCGECLENYECEINLASNVPLDRNKRASEKKKKEWESFIYFLFMRKTKSFFFSQVVCLNSYIRILFWPVKDLGHTGGPWIIFFLKKYLIKYVFLFTFNSICKRKIYFLFYECLLKMCFLKYVQLFIHERIYCIWCKCEIMKKKNCFFYLDLNVIIFNLE